jgi:hypothetical protein
MTKPYTLEAKELLLTLTDTAMSRTLTLLEATMIGQLLAQHTMAVEARMLGHKPGRYFVISEEAFLRANKKEVTK